MSWCPIFPAITESSVWRLPAHVFKSWIAILTHKDHETHIWRGNEYTLADMVKISEPEAKEALLALSSPDPRSLTRDHEGRRILSDDGEHWFVVNGEKYQSMIRREIERENARLRTQKWRAGKKKVLDAPDDNRFDEFWSAYPRKVAREKAKTAWKQVKKDEIGKILEDISLRRVTEDWTKEGGKYIPHPTTYLNGKRWNDERTPSATKTVKQMTDEEILREVIG